MLERKRERERETETDRHRGKIKKDYKTKKKSLRVDNIFISYKRTKTNFSLLKLFLIREIFFSVQTDAFTFLIYFNIK